MYACWVQPESYSNAAGADATITALKNLGIDTAMFCISGCPVYYRSKLLPNSGRVTANFDPLAYAIARCREINISPHVWWCVGFLPKDSAFRSRYPGLSIADVVSGLEHWLYFGSPAAQKLAADVCAEIAAYKPDGVHLDVIRYQYDFAYIDWDQPRPQFSGSHVTETVRQCSAAIPAPMQLTAAVFPGLKNASYDHMQPWPDWVRDGLVSHVLTMAYTDDAAQYTNWLAEYTSLPGRERIVPGVMLWSGSESANGPISAAQLNTQVQAIYDAAFPSFTLFDNRAIGQSASLDAAIQAITKETSMTTPSVADLNTLAAVLRKRADEINTHSQQLLQQAQNLYAHADEAIRIAGQLANADKLADELAAAL